MLVINFGAKVYADGLWTGQLTVTKGERTDALDFNSVEASEEISDYDLAKLIFDAAGIPFDQPE